MITVVPCFFIVTFGLLLLQLRQNSEKMASHQAAYATFLTCHVLLLVVTKVFHTDYNFYKS